MGQAGACRLPLFCGPAGGMDGPVAAAVPPPGPRPSGTGLRQGGLPGRPGRRRPGGELHRHRVDNVLLTAHDIERLHLIFGEADRMDRVYINFCNPWPKQGDHKHRLTHTRQLLSYRRWMKEGAEVWFKTDDDTLFQTTVDRYLPQAGYRVEYLTRDLHAADFLDNVPTEHEEMFASQGITTKFLIARAV